MFSETDFLINAAKSHLDESQSVLNQIIEEIASNQGNATEENTVLSIQLILQYRLSCEDALSFLLKMDRNLLYFLGIQPKNSAQMNLDRLEYALGTEDLKQILNILAILTGSLSKLVERYKAKHASFITKDKLYQKKNPIITKLTTLMTKQKQFLETIQKLDLDIEQRLKLQAAGPVYDHIAALRGPISQFYQAILHGLGQTKQLYQQINKSSMIEDKLHVLVNEAEKALHSILSNENLPHAYALKQFDHPTSSEQLEKRASAKRLQPFFG